MRSGFWGYLGQLKKKLKKASRVTKFLFEELTHEIKYSL